MRFTCIIFFVIFFIGCVSSTKKPIAKMRAQSTYDIEVKKLINKSKDVDFYELRMAYTDTKDYSPYTFDKKNTNKAFSFLRNKNFKKCLETSSEILRLEYVNLDGHLLSMICNTKLGFQEKSDYHKYVFLGLFKSIKNNGDGKSMDTAYTTISTNELYSFLNINNLSRIKQTLMSKGGKSYDVMYVINKENKKSTLYFDISKQMAQINKLFNK